MIALRTLATSEQLKICPLFEQVFGHPITPALLHWKYGDERGLSWVAESADATLLMHCGVYFRDVLCFGEPVRAAQLVDLMAAPKPSGLSRQQAPFPLLMQKLLTSLPSATNRAGLAFGFPSERAMRLGQLAGVYAALDDWLELRFTPAGDGVFSCATMVEPLAHSATIDKLWQDMRRDFPDAVLGVRDASFVAQRYVGHPEKDYVFLLIHSRWGARPLALAVISQQTGNWEIMDLIGAWNDLPAALTACRGWLRRAAGERLSLMLPAGFARCLAPFAQSCAKTQFQIMANPMTATPLMQRLPGAWWLTGGDTDYR